MWKGLVTGKKQIFCHLFILSRMGWKEIEREREREREREIQTDILTEIDR